MGDAAQPTAFIRHDVDVSLSRAVGLARKEKPWGACSTYHVMMDSPFYAMMTPPKWRKRSGEPSGRRSKPKLDCRSRSRT